MLLALHFIEEVPTYLSENLFDIIEEYDIDLKKDNNFKVIDKKF